MITPLMISTQLSSKGNSEKIRHHTKTPHGSTRSSEGFQGVVSVLWKRGGGDVGLRRIGCLTPSFTMLIPVTSQNGTHHLGI